MGFFSRIKKLWGGDAAPTTPEPSSIDQAPAAAPLAQETPTPAQPEPTPTARPEPAEAAAPLPHKADLKAKEAPTPPEPTKQEPVVITMVAPEPVEVAAPSASVPQGPQAWAQPEGAQSLAISEPTEPEPTALQAVESAPLQTTETEPDAPETVAVAEHEPAAVKSVEIAGTVPAGNETVAPKTVEAPQPETIEPEPSAAPTPSAQSSREPQPQTQPEETPRPVLLETAVPEFDTPQTAEPEAVQVVETEPGERVTPEAIEAPLPDPIETATPEVVAPPATDPEPARTEKPMPEPIQTPEPAPVVESEPAQPKASGWRRFFGLAPKATTPLETPQSETPQPETVPEPSKPELLFQEKPSAKPAFEPWQENLVTALRGAEPRLSIWMGHMLDGVNQRGDVLWTRLRFLFAQLDVPVSESEDFIARFDTWLLDMDYDRVEEFRSELQYRMALALDLEDEEDERNRLFLKLSAGLGKTREQLTMRIDQLLSLAGGYDDEFWEELEEILLMADVGLTATQELLKRLKPKVRKAGTRDATEFKALLKEELIAVFVEPTAPTVPQLPEVVLMVGVNGAGKTTTIAKLAHRAQMQGRKVLVAAGDTFRAAAIEQLQVWSKRVGAGFYAKAHGCDPAAVAFEAVDHAIKEGYDLVFVDTAGRLQTKHNLMEELKKINRVLGKKLEGAPHRTILVLDATTGQNALSQVKLFSQASPVDEIVLTKLDGTAKGGIIVAIALEFGIPISFVGLGEKMEDLRPFSGPEFASALFD